MEREAVQPGSVLPLTQLSVILLSARGNVISVSSAKRLGVLLCHKDAYRFTNVSHWLYLFVCS